MAMAAGFGKLQTARDLFDKLRHDYRRMQSDPTDQYAAFDFFVTAEHILDWHLPGAASKAAREQLRRSDILLEVTSHIASGSKHFVAEARHHQSVSHVDAPPPVSDELIVTLEGQAASQLGSSISVLPLATQVLKFWESRL